MQIVILELILWYLKKMFLFWAIFIELTFMGSTCPFQGFIGSVLASGKLSNIIGPPQVMIGGSGQSELPIT